MAGKSSRCAALQSLPYYQFRPLLWYFWDRHWTWGHTMSGLTLQLDLAMLTLLLFGVAARVLRRTVARMPREWPALAVPALLCLLLQMHWTEPFYLHVPGAAYVQFPWRLLAIITPCLIALAYLLADHVEPREARLVFIAAACAWTVAGSGAFVPLVDARIPIDPPSLQGANFSGYREFEPTAAPPLGTVREAVVARWRDAGCQVDAPDPSLEWVAMQFRIDCARAGVVPLPLYATPLHRIQVSRFDRTQRCSAVPEIPAVCGVVLPAGPSAVDVTMPTMAGMVRDLATGMNTR
ncbi:MAG: hypothetical protein JSU08_10340 [Acidobacteria bacterium]|nr:hypothetical protein [Acidobacteriota bacterium]